MGQWRKTTCVLCVTFCGLEVLVENNQIVKVRPDKEHPQGLWVGEAEAENNLKALETEDGRINHISV